MYTAYPTFRRCRRYQLSRVASVWCVFYLFLVLLALSEFAVLRFLRVEHAHELPWCRDNVANFSVSTDGRWAVSVVRIVRPSPGNSFNSGIVIQNLPQRSTEPMYFSPRDPCCVTISSDGDRVALVCQNRLVLLRDRPADNTSDVECFGARFLHEARDTLVTDLVFAPDNEQLLAIGQNYIHLLHIPNTRSARTARPVRRWPGGDSVSVAFSADSRRAVVVEQNGRVRRYDTRSGSLIDSRTLTLNEVIHTAVSKDGATAAFLCARGTISAWDLSAGRKRWRADFEPAVYYDVIENAMDFTSDGRALIYAHPVKGGYRIYCLDAETGAVESQSARYRSTYKGMAATSVGVVYAWDLTDRICGWEIGGRGHSPRHDDQPLLPHAERHRGHDSSQGPS